MTQKDVVGDFITRNMLSQIESGAAMPSVKTLEYLCKVLDIQQGLISGDNGCAEETAGYPAVKERFAAGDYIGVVSADIPDGFYDEHICLKAMSCLRLAQSLLQSEDISDHTKALEYARQAEKLSGEGIFANPQTAEQARLVIKSAAAKLSEYYGGLA